jgi:hypothetical protein
VTIKFKRHSHVYAINIFGHIFMLAIFAVLFSSGFLLWPLRRWLGRNRKIRGRSLGVVFLLQVIVSIVYAFFDLLRNPAMLDYEWAGIWVELNIYYSRSQAALPWVRDARNERALETHHAA